VPAYNYEHFDAYVAAGEDEREFGAFPTPSTPVRRHLTAS